MIPAFSGDWPIPERVRLPGLRISVRIDPSMDVEGLWTYEVSEKVNRAVIRINGKLPIEVQRYVLLHELLHAVHEEIDVMLEKFPQQVWTKFMARCMATPTPTTEEDQP